MGVRLPIRGIIVVLIGAFFIHVFSWMLDVSQFLNDQNYLLYDGELKISFWSKSLSDLAYGTFYLGEAVIIELLYRLWILKKQ
ncbi:hypothetical protein MNBD_ALPHA05-1825 [hydrothermal vent metagenome]|uniref:Uncharacterized protein n=1 Tax=hydrothermal vent metagenome TaxID=652676 RepID=A0A3B0SGE9_9ZZZZ